jgi:hypothetical protein
MRLVLALCLLAGSAALSGCYVPATSASVEVMGPPPPPPAGVVVVHRPGYSWVDGYYYPYEGAWLWRPGYYVTARPGYYYRPGRYYYRGGRHVYVRPGWTTYERRVYRRRYR